MYYSGRYFYNDPPRQPKVEAKPIEYAFKDEVNYLKQEIDKHNNDIGYCLQAININRKDCEQMYQAIDILKNDVQHLSECANYLYSKINEAPSVAKRKRRVTICANGQVVEVCKHD
jgi:uncharacterized coiled-coil DUF342 family protein